MSKIVIFLRLVSAIRRSYPFGKLRLMSPQVMPRLNDLPKR
jgi:hypothetical protein